MTSQSTTRSFIPEPTDKQRAVLKAQSGSDDHVFASCLIARTLGTVPPDPEDAVMSAAIASTRTAMAALAPRDAVEGLLVSQAVGLHNGAMRCLQLAVSPSRTPESAARSWREAASLSRVMLDTLAALERYRQRTVDPTPT